MEAGFASSEARLAEEIAVLKKAMLHSKHKPLILAAEELRHGRLLVRVRRAVECGRAISADRLRKDVKIAREAGLEKLHCDLLQNADMLIVQEERRENWERHQQREARRRSGRPAITHG